MKRLIQTRDDLTDAISKKFTFQYEKINTYLSYALAWKNAQFTFQYEKINTKETFMTAGDDT